MIVKFSPANVSEIGTFYVRDASGNIMSIYEKVTPVASQTSVLIQKEISMYGSSRLGVWNSNRNVTTLAAIDYSNYSGSFVRGNKLFELSNHLGNVLVTLSDKKIGHDAGNGTSDYYTADVVTANDYYPGGMSLPGRKFSSSTSKYRYGFNGQEKSDEIKGEGNSYTAEFWEYDPRIGRRWNVDPVSKEWESPYATFSNNPIVNIDPNGDSDSTYKTPGGGTMNAETSTAQTFDGSTQKVGNINVTPAKGTLKSFREWNGGEPGETSRFIATFNTKSGEFAGYVWDGDMKTTYGEFSKAKREDLENMAANWDNPMYQHYSSREEARKSAINLTVGLAIPNVIIKPLTIAINIEKFTVDANKFNYFFGKVVTGPQTNIARSAQNLKDLTQLGITTEDKLMKVFSQAMQSGATVSTKVTQYGTNVMKSVNVGGKGSIEVGFFYKAGNMSAKPAVTTIIPKIFK